MPTRTQSSGALSARLTRKLNIINEIDNDLKKPAPRKKQVSWRKSEKIGHRNYNCQVQSNEPFSEVLEFRDILTGDVQMPDALVHQLFAIERHLAYIRKLNKIEHVICTQQVSDEDEITETKDENQGYSLFPDDSDRQKKTIVRVDGMLVTDSNMHKVVGIDQNKQHNRGKVTRKKATFVRDMFFSNNGLTNIPQIHELKNRDVLTKAKKNLQTRRAAKDENGVPLQPWERRVRQKKLRSYEKNKGQNKEEESGAVRADVAGKQDQKFLRSEVADKSASQHSLLGNLSTHSEHKAQLVHAIALGNPRLVQSVIHLCNSMCNSKSRRQSGQGARRCLADEREDCGTPFIVSAAMCGSIPVMRVLLENGAYIRSSNGRVITTDLNGWTPALCAAHYGHSEAVSYLQKECGDSSLPLNCALSMPRKPGVVYTRVLNKVAHFYQTELFVCTYYSSLKDVMDILEANRYHSDPLDVLDVCDVHFGNSPLHLACIQDDSDILEALLYYVKQSHSDRLFHRHWTRLNNEKLTPLACALLHCSEHVLWWCANLGIELTQTDIDQVQSLRDSEQPWPASIKACVARLRRSNRHEM